MSYNSYNLPFSQKDRPKESSTEKQLLEGEIPVEVAAVSFLAVIVAGAFWLAVSWPAVILVILDDRFLAILCDLFGMVKWPF